MHSSEEDIQNPCPLRVYVLGDLSSLRINQIKLLHFTDKYSVLVDQKITYRYSLAELKESLRKTLMIYFYG